jgi:hypothetical protein
LATPTRRSRGAHYARAGEGAAERATEALELQLLQTNRVLC